MVASLSGTLYIGVTNNIERRVWEPKTGQFDGFAGRYQCDPAVYCESFDAVESAQDEKFGEGESLRMGGWKCRWVKSASASSFVFAAPESMAWAASGRASRR